MTIRVVVEHRTSYRFDRPVGIGAHTESRRSARFTPYGHSPGPVDPSTWTTANLDGEYPRTLDLRRVAAPR